MSEQRRPQYRKDPLLEKFGEEMNDSLRGLEDSLRRQVPEKAESPIFIVGLQRSGTTLLNQLLLANFDFFYPNNLLARFWKAPLVGTLLSNSLKDHLTPREGLTSDLGYTEGLGGAHEFGYFWKQFFPTGKIVSNESIRSRQDLYGRLRESVVGMSHLVDKPVLFKNIVQLALNLEGIHEVLPEALFVHISREPFFVCQSTYLSRLRLYEDDGGWFGIVPPEVGRAKELPPLEQVVWQVTRSSSILRGQVARLPSEQILEIRYEQLVADPGGLLNRAEEFFVRNRTDRKRSGAWRLGDRLESGNTPKVSDEMREDIERLLEQTDE